MQLISKELTVENTTYCGAGCIMCPRERFRFPYRHMDNTMFKNIIDQGVESGMISLDMCGFGDSFMDPEFKNKLAYVKEKYPMIKVNTSTTGHMLHPKELNCICKYIYTLRISNYGFTKTVYDKVHRGSLKYERVKENIENLLSFEKQKRPFLAMQFLVLSENEFQVDDWKEYWEPRADEIMIWLPHNYGGSRFSKQLSEFKTDNNITPKTCGRPSKGNLFIRENGEVSMCCFDFNHQIIIGDLREQTLKEILAGKKLDEIRSIHSRGSFEDCEYICKDCDQIFPRQDALIYSSHPNRKVGVLNTHPDFIRDMLSSNKQPDL